MAPSHPHVNTRDVYIGCHVTPMQTPWCALMVLAILQFFQSQKKTRPSPSPELTNFPSGELLTYREHE